MVRTREEILNNLLDDLTNLQENVDTRQGSFCHDILSVMAYLVSSQDQVIENLQTTYDIKTMPISVLELVAKPRIGERERAKKSQYTYTHDGVVGLNSVWYYQQNTTQAYQVTDNTSFILESMNTGTSTNLPVGAVLFSSITPTDTMTIASILFYGQDEENEETYRQRYLNTVLLDQQPGMATYYKNKVSLLDNVSVAGVDEEESKTMGIVSIYAIGNDYKTLLETLLEELRPQIETFTPLMHSFSLRSFDVTNIDIVIKGYLNVKTPLTTEIVTPLLETFRVNFLIDLMNKNNLSKILYVSDIITYLVPLTLSYGTITDITINNVKELTITKQCFVFSTITIEGL